MWKVEYTRRFLKELAKAPQPIQQRVETIVFQELACESGWPHRREGSANACLRTHRSPQEDLRYFPLGKPLP
jgi:mRNA-degrading endonuclease RelE of RelBE toxin-antitoxin system